MTICFGLLTVAHRRFAPAVAAAPSAESVAGIGCAGIRLLRGAFERASD
jgi:hypothetical protein